MHFIDAPIVYLLPCVMTGSRVRLFELHRSYLKRVFNKCQSQRLANASFAYLRTPSWIKCIRHTYVSQCTFCPENMNYCFFLEGVILNQTAQQLSLLKRWQCSISPIPLLMKCWFLPNPRILSSILKLIEVVIAAALSAGVKRALKS